MATLTVTHTEDLTLNGVQQGTTNTLSIASVSSVHKRIVKIPSGVDTTILVFKDSVTDGNADTAQSAGGCLRRDHTLYFRITNIDSAHDCAVNIIGDANTGDDGIEDATDGIAAIGLKAGHSMLWGTVEDSFQVHDGAITILTEAALENIQRVVIEGGSNDVDIEIFVAGT